MGLQGTVSLIGPMQNLPRPRPYRPTRLALRFTPSQLAEQSPHSPHAVNSQSTLFTQGTITLQNSVSLSFPETGVPHSLAIAFTMRFLFLSPPLHEAEHGLHSIQSSQWPSTHCDEGHGCVLQGTNSCLSCASHGFPPKAGTCLMCLFLVF